MNTQLPSIYNYNDYRKYLNDYQEARYRFDMRFSKSGFSRMLGLPNTRSYFTDVLRGKKVTQTFLERFVRVLELSREEGLYLRILIQFNQAENLEEREIYFDQLISLNKTPKRMMDQDAYVYYREWYNSAVRAILEICNFSEDYRALAKKVCPRITPEQARKAVELLIRMGLVKKNESGFLKPTDKSISTAPFVRDELIKQYQLKCIDLAKNALIRSNGRPQSMSTNMLSISKEGYARIEKKIQRFKSEIRSLVQKDEHPADRVYQLDVFLFPGSL